MLLVIAGLDPTAKAGILKDLAVASSLNVPCCACLTANTIQTQNSFTKQAPIDPTFFQEQLQALLASESFFAVKIGFLSSLPIAKIVAEQLKRFNTPNIVIDPVILGKRLNKLLVDESLLDFYHDTLFPMASLITPNLAEAQTLSAFNTPEVIAQKLADKNTSKVLISGIEKDATVSDCLASPNASPVQWSHSEKINTSEIVVGRGCELSTRLACSLALGSPI